MTDIMLWRNMLASWVRPMDVQHTRELKKFGMVLLLFGTQEKVWEGVRERSAEVWVVVGKRGQ